MTYRSDGSCRRVAGAGATERLGASWPWAWMWAWGRDMPCPVWAGRVSERVPDERTQKQSRGFNSQLIHCNLCSAAAQIRRQIRQPVLQKVRLSSCCTHILAPQSFTPVFSGSEQLPDLSSCRSAVAVCVGLFADDKRGRSSRRSEERQLRE